MSTEETKARDAICALGAKLAARKAELMALLAVPPVLV